MSTVLELLATVMISAVVVVHVIVILEVYEWFKK